MALMIEIMGGRGVGKSTAILGVKEKYPDKVISKESFRKLKNAYDINKLEEFIEHERMYLNCEINEIKKLAEFDSVVLITRGPRDVLLYLDYMIEKVHPDWQYAYLALNKEIEELKSLFAETCIFFDGSNEFLLNNIRFDEKVRDNNQFWLEFNQFEKKKLINDRKVHFLSVDQMKKEEVVEYLLKFIKGEGKCQ